jgi:hypothetical protein
MLLNEPGASLARLLKARLDKENAAADAPQEAPSSSTAADASVGAQ